MPENVSADKETKKSAPGLVRDGGPAEEVGEVVLREHDAVVLKSGSDRKLQRRRRKILPTSQQPITSQQPRTDVMIF
jgi:hypothetical protein